MGPKLKKKWRQQRQTKRKGQNDKRYQRLKNDKKRRLE